MAKQVAPLVVIVGETASGKSDLAMFIARKFDGEIIAADSRTIYKGMDIGTAKPTADDQALIPHHLLDVVEPGERFTAAQFKEAATDFISEIWSRGHLPIMVGGTGLYVDAVIYNYDFAPDNPDRRRELEILSLQDLQQEARQAGIQPREVNYANRRHLQRAVERGGAGRANNDLRKNTLIIGTQRSQDELGDRIEMRIDAMLEAGFIDEVKVLLEKYGPDSEAMTGIGYRAFVKYLQGEYTLEQARAEFILNDKRLAKRQRTWFKRNKSIHYPLKQSDVVALVTTLLSKN